MAVDLSIIIVSWNVADLLAGCLQSLLERAEDVSPDEATFALGDHRSEIIVVDNASTDHTVAMLRSEYPLVRLIASERNLGFSAGNNLGLEHARGDCLLFLNPDTRVVDDAVQVMLRYLEEHPRVGLVGPRLRYADGSPQASRRRFPTLMMGLCESTLVEQWWPRNRWARAYRMEDTPDDVTQEVDWVNGACMLVRREAVDEVGALDEAFFMYSEELDWCRRMTAAGWRVAYLPTATVIHYEGQSSSQIAPMRQVYFDSSKILYFRKHHGALTAGVLRVALLAMHALHMAEEGLKYLLGHKRPLRRERLRAGLLVLRSGLRSPPRAGGHG